MLILQIGVLGLRDIHCLTAFPVKSGQCTSSLQFPHESLPAPEAGCSSHCVRSPLSPGRPECASPSLFPSYVWGVEPNMLLNKNSQPSSPLLYLQTITVLWHPNHYQSLLTMVCREISRPSFTSVCPAQIRHKTQPQKDPRQGNNYPVFPESQQNKKY